MDTFVDSSWYFMRYCSPGASDGMVDARSRYWMPMDQYIGGIEHAVLHLLYARFWTRVMRDLGLIDFDEPFQCLFTQGMLLNDSFYREDEAGRKRWFYPAEVELRTDERGRTTGAVAREDGLPVALGGMEKMSKSKNNVVEPSDIIARFGADTARAFVMFAGPPEQSASWSDANAEGTHRFLRRLWVFAHGVRSAPITHDALADNAAAGTARYELHRLLGQVNYDYERLQYNTVVSGAMKLLNLLETTRRSAQTAMVIDEGLGILLRVIYPVTPHITQALWTDLGLEQRHGELIYAPWPEPDPAALQREQVELVVQVNGKLRGSLRVAVDAQREAIEMAVLADETVARFVTGTPRKIVIVPGKLVNVVI
jgi:leucyl-tRNA synthetase